jgi:hypothetical protein
MYLLIPLCLVIVTLTFGCSSEFAFPCINSCADSLTNVLMTMHTFVATRCIMPNFATTCNTV